jgi:ribonuclease M5
MKRIRQLIVVEGRHDTAALKKYFDCDTIETGGTSLGDKVIEEIRTAKEKRGVIIFTDPDSPGNRIRNEINRLVPGCENAFIDKAAARTDKKVGVEHAAGKDLEEALENLIVYEDKPEETITAADMSELGLMGKDSSAELRRKAGLLLHIGFGSAKTMKNRLNCLGITKEELRKVLEENE